MDKKSLLLLKEYNQIIVNRTFTERDILGFFIFIRESLPQTGSLKELCHFIAHRNRTKGITYSFVEKIEKALNSNHTISTNDVLNEERVFYSPQIIKQELNDYFRNFNLTEANGLAVSELVICLMCILQAIPLFKPDGTQFCELSIYVYRDKVLLHANINWTLSLSEIVVPFGVPIMGIEYATNKIPDDAEEGSCIIRPDPFTAKRVGNKLIIE